MDQNFFRKDWENGEDAIWEDMTSSEEWTDRRRYQHGAESVLDARGKDWDRC